MIDIFLRLLFVSIDQQIFIKHIQENALKFAMTVPEIFRKVTHSYNLNKTYFFAKAQ